jgi:hypothetical protein
MKHALIVCFLLLLGLFGAGCGNSDSTTSKGNSAGNEGVAGEAGNQGGLTLEAGGLKLTSLEGTTAFPDARLKLVNPPAGADLAAGQNRIELDVKGFPLGQPTLDPANKGMINDLKGQHISLILNNGPMIPMYAPQIDQNLEDGHYVLLAFPSRSYHEGVKSTDGYALRQFNVGQPENFKELDTKAPHLFYHWPTGNMNGEKVLLDFFLVNCTLGANDYKVRAVVNGTEFMLTKWAAYTMEGLPAGENKVKLELLDAAGKVVESPYNPVERTFVVEVGS